MFREDSSSFDHSRTRESTSGQLPDDQQMGATTESMTGTEYWKLTSLCFLPRELNLNPARIALAEGLGTFILMFSICGIMGSMQLLGNQVGLLEYATTAGTAIVVIIFTLGETSGAHVNPAVTIAFAVFGHFPWKKVPLYVIAQLLGSLLATYVGQLVFRVNPEVIMTVPLKDHAFAAFVAEFIATFIVTFLAASLARDAKSVGHLAGFVMGIAIALAVLITGPLSGGSLNPARSIGPAILAWKLDQIWIYFIAPVAGAILGVLMVHALCLHHQPPQSHNLSAARSVLP
ncbi:probable aquaporin NIP7-1 [Chenopodium quinoa]|uniref:probable aquaporin NIP7-1 n=1 Tax=Chenopodium quinoa TaxID=63459 RepID=UPI000B78FA51|nr:probable aquaporin NIP7-1 [Chenopodium quinoa]